MSTPYIRFSPDADDHLVRTLEFVQQALFRHPIAAQATFAWLAAEGRRFAKTPEGEAWRERLVGSELIAQLRLIWDSLGMTAFVEKPTETLPSFFIDALVTAASSGDVEALLTRVMKRRM
jgi:hypothetical protein